MDTIGYEASVSESEAKNLATAHFIVWCIWVLGDQIIVGKIHSMVIFSYTELLVDKRKQKLQYASPVCISFI